MDPSIILLKPSFIDMYYNEMKNFNYDICFFEFRSKTTNIDYPYLENWFIMEKKDCLLLTEVYYEFNKAKEMGFIKYKKTFLRRNDFSLENTIIGEDQTYLLQHAIIQYLLFLNKKEKYNILIKDADESLMAHYSKFDSDANRFKNYLLNLQNMHEMDYLYAFKLTGDWRAVYNDNEIIHLFKKLDKYIDENKK